MFDKFIGALSKDIAIDLGTANTVVIVKGEGVVINEPSVVAVQTDKRGTDRILAVGYEAKEVAGKTPDRIKVVRPMKDGVIADFEITEKLIRFFIEKAHKQKFFVRPRVMVCVPYGLTGVEKKAVRESVLGAGAREVYLIEEPMAAAIGAGLQIDEAKGNLVIDIGGGTTEIGVVSYSGLVVSKSIKVAGDKFDMAIQDYVRKKYNLLVGERTAEEIKLEIGSASPLENPLTYQVNGRDNVSGLLNTVPLTSEDCREAMKEQLKEIASALKSVLEGTPPDLSGDIVENGIALTGGGALIRGLDKYLSDIVKLPVYVAEEPLLCVAKGTGMVMEDPRLLEVLAIE